MTKFSDRGMPILLMHEKLAVLGCCVTREAWEDVAGHLCDLLEHCRKKSRPSVRCPFKDLLDMVTIYGEHPTPIDESPD